MQHRKKTLSAIGTALVAMSMFVAVAPAAAASANGTKLCVSPRYPQLYINSSASGNGTWVNYDTAASTQFSFPGGASYRYSPYVRVNWTVANGTSGFWYSYPSATCVV